MMYIYIYHRYNIISIKFHKSDCWCSRLQTYHATNGLSVVPGTRSLLHGQGWAFAERGAVLILQGDLGGPGDSTEH